MPLGGRWHRAGDIEVIPVLTPTLVVSRYGPEFNDCAMPGEFLVIEGLLVYKATYAEVQENFICDEAPELALPVVGNRELQ